MLPNRFTRGWIVELFVQSQEYADITHAKLTFDVYSSSCRAKHRSITRKKLPPLTCLASPQVVAAVVGYGTNWVGVKMLFRRVFWEILLVGFTKTPYLALGSGLELKGF